MIQTETEGIKELQPTVLCPTCGRPIPASTTTLKSPYRVWGKTLEVLCILSEFGGLTVKEIGEKTGIPYKMVHQCCKRDFERGFIEPDLWGWRLTPTGKTIVEYNNTINNNNNSPQIILNQSSNNPQIILNQSSNKPKKSRQLNIELYLEKEDLSEDERVVVEALARHYEETGQKAKARPYFIVKDYYEFRTKIGFDPKFRDEDVQDIAISLQSNGYLYIIPQGKRLKIGLTSETIEKLQHA
ncbi:MAG: MarR family winged helix-turn-helix transcriptional regulator [Candidatus Methanoperedens sp.]|nr:MarR family winged helix-turn-helix transcriptional regulator [Candidatus Methanoperedens sp.]